MGDEPNSSIGANTDHGFPQHIKADLVPPSPEDAVSEGENTPSLDTAQQQPLSKRPASGEFYRKLLHMSPGVLPFVLGLVPLPTRLDWVSQSVVTAVCIVMTFVFLSLRRVVRRPGEENFLSTTVSYPAAVIFTVLLFPEHVELTGVVVVILAFGDGSAYIGGKLFGKRVLPWNPLKTWMGTLCFAVVSAPIAALAYYFLAVGTGFDAAKAAIACGTAAAIAGAIAESLPMQLTDNLRVGAAAILSVAAMQYAVVGLKFF